MSRLLTKGTFPERSVRPSTQSLSQEDSETDVPTRQVPRQARQHTLPRVPLVDFQTVKGEEATEAESSYSTDSMRRKGVVDTALGKGRSLSTEYPSTVLDEIFRCFVCFGRLEDPKLCPCCGKMCCHSCIRRWLTQHSECPHCRSELSMERLISCRFVEEIKGELERFQFRSESDSSREMICQKHDLELKYFDVTCGLCICAECAMFTEEHRTHKFDKLESIYKKRTERIRSESDGLKSRADTLKHVVEKFEHEIQRLNIIREHKMEELFEAFEQFKTKIDAQINGKMSTLVNKKNALEEEIFLLESMYQEVERQLTRTPKSILISKAEELATALGEVHRRPVGQFSIVPVEDTDIFSEAVPSYRKGVLKIENYTELVRSRSCDVILSEPIVSNGLVWRLKVYPTGNGDARDCFISVFLELVSGYSEPLKYEYKIQLVSSNGSIDSSTSISRVYTSMFEEGECWGYNRFCKIDTILQGGFLDENGYITFAFYVRPLSYFQLCVEQQYYIQKLEKLAVSANKPLEATQKYSLSVPIAKDYNSVSWNSKSDELSNVEEEP
eukprot:jgi/Galph1/4722/GphlegSOOS_G3400.1